MEALVSLKNECEDFTVEFEVLPSVDFSEEMDERQRRIVKGIASVDGQLEENQKVIDKLNADIDKLTNHADGLDYMVAVASGILAGVIDIIFVEDFSFERANVLGGEKVNDFVLKVARSQGYKGDDLNGAVKFLEEKFPIAADKAINDFGGGRQHHLRDFSHHPTPVGLFFSFLTQFTGKVYGTDVAGVFKVVPLKEGDLILVGKNLPEKVTFGIINWFFHMVSDMAGSSGSIHAGKDGTGLPGPIVSLLKEISALPIFKNLDENGYKEFSVWISKLFNGTLLGKRDDNGKLIPIKFDLRTEIGVAMQLGQQAIPVIINECIVRGFYFIRRLFMEIRENDISKISDLKNINWENTLPFKNRTVIRMLTISTGTMTAIDLADAAIESGGIGLNMLVKVNFVGIGRFAIAVGSDVKMGVKRSKLRNEKIVLMNEQIFLLNGKTFYKQAQMWIAAESAGKTIEEAYALMEETSKIFSAAYNDIIKDMDKISGYVPEIEKKNKNLINDINDILKWG